MWFCWFHQTSSEQLDSFQPSVKQQDESQLHHGEERIVAFRLERITIADVGVPGCQGLGDRRGSEGADPEGEALSSPVDLYYSPK